MPTPSEAALPTFAELQRELPTSTPRAWRFAALLLAAVAAATGYTPATITADRAGISRVVRLLRAEAT